MDATPHAHALPHAHSRGTWGGHVLPGTFFALWGVWWLLSAISRWRCTNSADAKATFQSRPFWPLSTRPLLEPQLKTVLPLVGVLVELWLHPGDVRWRHALDATGEHWVAHSIVNWQHATMYSAFALSGVVDWLSASGRVVLPEGVSWACLSGAFFIEAFLLVEHLRMQAGLMWDIHLLLIGAVLANALAVAASAQLQSFTSTLVCAWCTIAQGGWFLWQARILYGANPWDREDEDNAMMLPVVFVFHLLAVASLVLAVVSASGHSALQSLWRHHVEDELRLL